MWSHVRDHEKAKTRGAWIWGSGTFHERAGPFLAGGGEGQVFNWVSAEKRFCIVGRYALGPGNSMGVGKCTLFRDRVVGAHRGVGGSYLPLDGKEILDRKTEVWSVGCQTGGWGGAVRG